MSGLFVALTMPAAHGFDEQPIFVNASLIRFVNPRRVRRLNPEGRPMNGGPEAHMIDGTWITTGDDEEQTFPVTQSYGEVTGAIRDALA